MNESPGSAQSAQKVEIFEQRQCAKPTDSIVSLAPDEDPGVPIAEPKDSEHRVYSSQLSCGSRRPVKNQPKIAAHNQWTFHVLPNLLQSMDWRSGIGVYKPEHISCGFEGPSMHL